MAAMSQQGAHGQPGANSDGGNAQAPASGAGDLAEIKALLSGLTSELAALKTSVPATVNAAITKRLKSPAAAPKAEPQGDGDQGDDGDGTAPTGAPPKPAKPARNPEVEALRAQLQAMQTAQAEAAAKAAAARRETSLRGAIAQTGFDLHDPEAVFRFLSPDLEPDEDQPERLRPRDVAHQGKPLDAYVKERIASMKWAHRPTTKATAGPTGDAKPDAGGFQWDPSKPVTPEVIEAWRANEAAKKR